MIKIALPSKGRLLEQTLELLTGCGYRAEKRQGTLSCLDAENNIEFYFLRPVDIPLYVANGTLDGGITGRDFVAERGESVHLLLDLNYGHSRLCAAVMEEAPITDLRSAGPIRVATSFPELTRHWLGDAPAKLVVLEGSVEVSVKLGIADAIVDVVETGNSLRQAGMRVLGEPIFQSNAALFAHPGRETLTELVTLAGRLRGRMVAAEYMMVEYDVPQTILQQACAITPGIQSPTVMSLNEPGWFSVKSVLRRREAHRVMDELERLGCKGILLTSLESARM